MLHCKKGRKAEQNAEFADVLGQEGLFPNCHQKRKRSSLSIIDKREGFMEVDQKQDFGKVYKNSF